MNRATHQLLLALLAAFLTSTIAFAETNTINFSIVSTNISITPTNLAQLLTIPPEQLDKVDIALIDLLCAEGLPGAENLDLKQCLKTLDEWASEVKSETERNYHRFTEHPEKYKNSLGRYRMAVMAAVFSQDLNVQYNPLREKELLDNHYFNDSQPYGEAERSFFSNSSDFFLHGIVSDKRYGTCTSMPYLYVAIGRRLGYPVSIAATHMHNYVYYDEGNGKHFNLEATENRGFVTPTDDEYRNPPWGAPTEKDYFESRGLLRPMSNQVAMAHLLADRAGIYRSAGRHDDEAKTWATAARYFPDTPTWKMIEENMQQCAKLDEYHQWRDGIWKELAGYVIPRGPGYAYFLDKRINLYLFMNECLDRKAVEKAADEFKKELAEYSKTAMKPIVDATASDQSPTASKQLFLHYRPADGGDIEVPADYMPPFAGGVPPVDLQQRISNAKPQDGEAMLELMWEYYAQMQMMQKAKEKAEIARIMSGNKILISEESIPPEYRQGVPRELAMRLSGMHNAKDIVIEMRVYQSEQQARGRRLQSWPMSQQYSSLRRAGISDAEAQRQLQPGLDNPVPMPSLADLDSRRPGMSPMPGYTASGFNRDPSSAYQQRIQEANEQAMQLAQQIRNPQNMANMIFPLPYQVVPASVAAGNPAVENPMPMNGLQNPPLTPEIQLPIKTPITTHNGP